MKRTLIIWIVLLLFSLSPIMASGMDFVAEEVYESVVVIYTSSNMGSGFAFKPDMILTNAHVVKDNSTVLVERYDGSTIQAKVVKKDTDMDLAVLSVTDANFPVLSFSETAPSIGDDVYAIGAPNNIPYTMTRGIISALERQIENQTYLQIDASINSGNSGGPLLNSQGQVLGINTSKLENAEGIGFAIPSDVAMAFVENVSSEPATSGDAPMDDGSGSTSDYEDLLKQYQRVLHQNESLRIGVIVLSVLLFVTVLLLIRSKIKAKEKKKKNEFDFEIEFEE